LVLRVADIEGIMEGGVTAGVEGSSQLVSRERPRA
jgi:hypothetical protein